MGIGRCPQSAGVMGVMSRQSDGNGVFQVGPAGIDGQKSVSVSPHDKEPS
jgi:hypothetical protein